MTCAQLLVLLVLAAPAWAESGLLMQNPTMNKTEIVFSYAGDLWTVPRVGGEAQRLTTGPGKETNPIFSPDGKTIAFTGEYDGNIDVFTVPVTGGIPKRLTHHPDIDSAVGWSPDGARILFVSMRSAENDSPRFFTVSAEGGFPTPVPLPMAVEGCYSPDGKQIAYGPIFHWQAAWKRYRGGQTTPIWIANLADSQVKAIPRDNSNDTHPMWVGSDIYFLSDRSGPTTLFRYNTASGKVSQAIENHGLDFKSASAGPDGIVYEQFGSIGIYSFANHQAHKVDIRISADFPEVRPRFVKIKPNQIANATISPSGARAVFEARGEVLTLPAEKGALRNLTHSPGVEDRNPVWSPDGKSIAWFSDESGEYALHIGNQDGLGECKKIDLGNPHSYFYTPAWSPDSKKIVFTDKWLNLWYVDIEKGAKIKAGSTSLDDTQQDMNPAWSPDSRWIVYTKLLPTFYHQIYVYSLDTGKSTPLTDGMSDATSPVFDRSGKYLYFTASTNIGLAAGGNGGNLSSIERPKTSNVYVMVLSKKLGSPLAPESDDEKAEEPKPAATAGDKTKTNSPAKTEIDFDGISQRILALPVAELNYLKLWAGAEGTLFLWSTETVQLKQAPPAGPIDKFDLSKRKTERFADGVQSADLSASGEKILYKQGEKWFITGTQAPAKPGEGALNLDALEVWSDPRAEWKQMYRETWRIERDFLYDPHFHGLDLKQTEARYAPFVDGLASRADLNYLFEEMLGELTLGHVFVGGGDLPDVKHTSVGLLGADYSIENGRYRFSRIFNGENWNPELRAPLTQPGVNVQAGEYLLRVQGQDVRPPTDLYSYFGETAGKPIVITVSPNPDGSGARDVTVVPVDNEKNLRHLAWVEDNRRKVEIATGGRVGYVHVPDTGLDGYTSFNRYYFAQSDKQAVIVDERFNHGGLLADYIVELLNRQLLSKITYREGIGTTTPAAAIYGPRVMITNQFAGSGGDALPWYFHKLSLGPLVGKRTWGGLVGISGYPDLMDGGHVTAPRAAIYGLNGEWEVENHGVSPDYDVELDPAQWRQGKDTQLDKSIEVVLDLLQKNPPKTYPKPEYPNYHSTK